VIVYSFFIVFIALTFVYMLFLFRMRQGLAILQRGSTRGTLERPDSFRHKVSVIVPVRNEANVVMQCITSLKAQVYDMDTCEFIIVDDGSEDATALIVQGAIADDPRFTLLLLDADVERGKKAAITKAIQCAKGEIVLTTDADCTHDPKWIAKIVAEFARGADIVGGPVVYTERDTVFQRLEAMEFLGIIGVGAGFFGIGYPHLCNGANLAYRKECFFRVGGYEGNEKMASGDDEFLLHKIVYGIGGEATFLISQESIVSAAPTSNIYSFLLQRQRWAGKGIHYGDSKFVAFLIMLFVYFLLCTAAPFFAWISQTDFLLCTILFCAKFFAESAVLFKTAAMLRQPIRVGDLFLAELLHPVYLVAVTVLGTFGNLTWKGRKVKNT